MPDPFEVERARTEAELARRLGRELGDQERAIIAKLGFPPDASRLTAAFMAGLAASVAALVQDVLEAGAMGAAEAVVGTIGVSLGSSVYKESVRLWAAEHAYELSRYVNDSTRLIVGDAITRYLETPGMTRTELEDLLAPAFGAQRASTIAVTEVTSSITAGTRAAMEEAQAAGLEVREVWRTQDGGCPEICAPLEGTYRGDGWDLGPPDDSHPNCACWTDLEWA